MEHDLPHHLAAAALLITDHGGRVLMVATDYRDTLVLPGGIIEPDESPAGRQLTRQSRFSAMNHQQVGASASTCSFVRR